MQPEIYISPNDTKQEDFSIIQTHQNAIKIIISNEVMVASQLVKEANLERNRIARFSRCITGLITGLIAALMTAHNVHSYNALPPSFSYNSSLSYNGTFCS